MNSSSDSDGTPASNDPWRLLLRELGVEPSKALGQNFLHDRKIVRRIVREAGVGPDNAVLEVGPGLGILTRELVAHAGSVTAIELDTRLARRIGEYFGDDATVIQGDILTLELDEIVPTDDYLVVANLPYSIATAAIQRLCEARHPPKRMVLMVQREVAERMTARPPRMSILAVAVQFFGQVRTLFRIGSGAFIPPPRVESAVVRIDTHREPLLPREDHAGFFRLVRAGFAQRRKRLDNSIASNLEMTKADVAARLQEAGIDPSRRAETLDVLDWIRIYQRIGDADFG